MGHECARIFKGQVWISRLSRLPSWQDSLRDSRAGAVWSLWEQQQSCPLPEAEAMETAFCPLQGLALPEEEGQEDLVPSVPREGLLRVFAGLS